MKGPSKYTSDILSYHRIDIDSSCKIHPRDGECIYCHSMEEKQNCEGVIHDIKRTTIYLEKKYKQLAMCIASLKPHQKVIIYDASSPTGISIPLLKKIVKDSKNKV